MTGWEESEPIDAATFDEPDEVTPAGLSEILAQGHARRVRVNINGHMFPVTDAFVDRHSGVLVLMPGTVDVAR